MKSQVGATQEVAFMNGVSDFYFVAKDKSSDELTSLWMRKFVM
jgi:hypothetical protein